MNVRSIAGGFHRFVGLLESSGSLGDIHQARWWSGILLVKSIGGQFDGSHGGTRAYGFERY